MKHHPKRFRKILLLTVLGAAVVLLAVLLVTRLEGEKPRVVLDLPSADIGTSQDLTLTVSDLQSGLRAVRVVLIQDGRSFTLFEKDFPGAGFWRGGSVRSETFQLTAAPPELGLADGAALLQVAVQDYAWRRWWRGNQSLVAREIAIDTRPPRIDVLTRVHNINRGGAGLVVYRLSESCPRNGVAAGENFFPGHSGFFDDSDVYLALIALGYDQGRGTDIYVQAADAAGNSAKAGFPYYIKNKSFNKDRLEITDAFLQRKMPEFHAAFPDAPPESPRDQFLWVNRQLRRENYDRIVAVCKSTENRFYWEGPFLRLPGSARRAGFADYREYIYEGQVIDRQVHLGIDLASTRHAAVPAANGGKVVFAEAVGIYGKTVIVDHGFGLFSMYSHLSSFHVEKGQIVSKGEPIGQTGMTGLAGGDHLHFSMLVHQTFVNPIEWWDPAWIQNNITAKIENLTSATGAY